MKRKSLLALVSGALAFSLLFTGCGANKGGDDSGELKPDKTDKHGTQIFEAPDASKNPDNAKNRKDTVVIGSEKFNGIFNPLFADSAYDIYVCETIFESLLEVDFDGKMVKGLADYKISNDGKTYTFTLKDGLKYHDGTPIKASDFAFALKIYADPTYDGSADLSSAKIVGYKEYKEDKAGKITDIPGCKVINDKTLEITLEAPYGPALEDLSLPAISEAYYGKNFKKGDLAGIKALMQKPMGSGQYVFKEYKEDQYVKLEANASYHKGTPKIKNLEFSVTPSGQELQRASLGETDFDMGTASVEEINTAKSYGFLNTLVFPTNGYGYIGMNGPEFDKLTRQALIYATDRAQVTDAVYSSFGHVINAPVSTVSWANLDKGLNEYKFDLKKSEKLLADAGWKKNANGKLERNGKEFVINFSASENNPVLAVALPLMKESFEKLGITFNIETLDFPTLRDKVANKKAQMWFMAWGLNPDPSPKTVYHSKGTQNYYGYNNPKTDELIDKALAETDIKKRTALYHELWKVINDDVPCMWVYQRSDAWYANSRIKNIELSPFRKFTMGIYKWEIAQ